MPQTLLALCALLIFSVYALSRHRDDAGLERRAVSDELELAAAGLLRERLAALDLLAFDEADVGRTSIRTVPPAGPLGLDAGETATGPFDDIDDVDGLVESRAAQTGVGTVLFDVRYAVRYVDPADPATPSATPTLAKEVSVQATEVAAGPTERPPVSATLRRVFTPAGMTSALTPR